MKFDNSKDTTAKQSKLFSWCSNCYSSTCIIKFSFDVGNEKEVGGVGPQARLPKKTSRTYVCIIE